MNKHGLVTISIPCFNEEKNVVWAYENIKRIVDKDKKYNYEIIFVDNGSTDDTKKLIKQLVSKDKCVKGVFLSRNFGPEASGKAAIDSGSGDAVILLPCDLQDPPELIPELIKKWEDGYDIVLSQYKKSEDSIFMTFLRKLFYSLFKKISDIDVPINVSGFGLMTRKVIDTLNQLPEKYRFNRGLLMWIGFKKAFISYNKRKRINGKSYYNFFRYLKHSERGVFGFSYLPLDVMIYSGFILTGLSFVFIVIYLLMVFVFGNPINASIPIMLAVVFFGGINLLALSIIGKYVQVIVEETKNRPVYIVDEKLNF